MVFVALDGPDGKPTPVPRWEPHDDGERRLQAQAKQLLELSKGMEQLVDLHGASPDLTLPPNNAGNSFPHAELTSQGVDS